jgi:hypothetical protein
MIEKAKKNKEEEVQTPTRFLSVAIMSNHSPAPICKAANKSENTKEK